MQADGATQNREPLSCPQCGGDRWIETTTLVETSVGRFVLAGDSSLQIQETRPIQDVRTVGHVFHCMSCGLQVTPADMEDPELFLPQAQDAADDQPLPRTHLTLDDAREKLAGWHFNKARLSESELEILAVAEALLRELERRSP